MVKNFDFSEVTYIEMNDMVEDEVADEVADEVEDEVVAVMAIAEKRIEKLAIRS